MPDVPHMKKYRSIIGRRSGKLKVVRFLCSIEGRGHWLCKCDCGMEKIVPRNEFLRGGIKSCGCLQDKHGLSKLFEGTDLTRERIRQRDNHTCQICEKRWQQGTRRFDVHHKDFDKEKSKKYENYKKEKDNMITLCHKCHLNLPEHRLAMKLGKRLGKQRKKYSQFFKK